MRWQDTIIKINNSVSIDTKLKSAISYQQVGQQDKAKRLYMDILSQDPKHVVALHLLGVIKCQEGDTDQAIELIEKAIVLKSDYTEAYNNLGIIFQEQGNLEKAVATCHKALKLNPNFVEAHYNQANALNQQGKLKEALMAYRMALKLDPNFSEAHRNLICCMNYNTQTSQQEIFAESQRWNNIHTSSLDINKHFHPNNRDVDRQLRIGYVSPDFCEHSVSYFFDPVISEHDHQLFEVFCYSDVAKADDKTLRFRNLSNNWRSTTGMTDSAIANQICKDHIDILVDLAGHTRNNRLLVFAERPAPVQVTWLGYPNTTGLSTMDYRLTDIIADPEGIDDTLYSETLVRLPNGFLCFTLSTNAPEIAGLPALASDHITFGSFNALSKITPEVVETWARILKRVPKSQIIIKNQSLGDKETCKRYLEMFHTYNIDIDRINLCSWIETKSGHLEAYNQIDIGLDPFPYNGTATTCEALWMGVPVITLRGNRHSGRVGASILTQINLSDLIAETMEIYIEKAVTLANDFNQISVLRGGLRERMQTSSLCDAKRFTKDIETAYRDMWYKTRC